MDYESAKKLVLDTYPDLTIQSAYEYKNIFVFDLHSKDVTDAMGAFSFSVEKTSGEIRTFKPFDISIKDYDSGKRIEGMVKKSDVRLVR